MDYVGLRVQSLRAQSFQRTAEGRCVARRWEIWRSTMSIKQENLLRVLYCDLYAMELVLEGAYQARCHQAQNVRAN